MSFGSWVNNIQLIRGGFGLRLSFVVIFFFFDKGVNVLGLVSSNLAALCLPWR